MRDTPKAELLATLNSAIEKAADDVIRAFELEVDHLSGSGLGKGTRDAIRIALREGCEDAFSEFESAFDNEHPDGDWLASDECRRCDAADLARKERA